MLVLVILTLPFNTKSASHSHNPSTTQAVSHAQCKLSYAPDDFVRIDGQLVPVYDAVDKPMIEAAICYVQEWFAENPEHAKYSDGDIVDKMRMHGSKIRRSLLLFAVHQIKMKQEQLRRHDELERKYEEWINESGKQNRSVSVYFEGRRAVVSSDFEWPKTGTLSRKEVKAKIGGMVVRMLYAANGWKEQHNQNEPGQGEDFKILYTFKKGSGQWSC